MKFKAKYKENLSIDTLKSHGHLKDEEGEVKFPNKAVTEISSEEDSWHLPGNNVDVIIPLPKNPEKSVSSEEKISMDKENHVKNLNNTWTYTCTQDMSFKTDKLIFKDTLDPNLAIKDEKVKIKILDDRQNDITDIFDIRMDEKEWSITAEAKEPKDERISKAKKIHLLITTHLRTDIDKEELLYRLFKNGNIIKEKEEKIHMKNTVDVITEWGVKTSNHVDTFVNMPPEKAVEKNPVLKKAKLKISKKANNKLVSAGKRVNYSINVNNTSKDTTAKDIVLEDFFDNFDNKEAKYDINSLKITLNGRKIKSKSVNISKNKMIIDAGINLKYKDTLKIEYSATMKKPGKYKNIATAKSSNTDDAKDTEFIRSINKKKMQNHKTKTYDYFDLALYVLIFILSLFVVIEIRRLNT